MGSGKRSESVQLRGYHILQGNNLENKAAALGL